MLALPASETLKLYDEQRPHVECLLRSLDKWGIAYDSSDTGEGKTFHVSYIAKSRRLKLVVVAPKTVCQEKWDKVPRKYGIPSICYSYALVSSGLRGLLIKQEIPGEGVIFSATTKLIDIFDSNTLLVFDEAHYMKNPDTIRLEACSELVRVGRMKGAKCIYLSATPIDKPQHAAPMFRVFGIMPYRSMYTYNRRTKDYEALGISGVETIAKEMDMVKFRLIHIPANLITRANINKYAFDLLNQIILPTIRCGITSDLALKHDIKNLFVRMNPDRRAELFRLISELEHIERQIAFSKKADGNRTGSGSGFQYRGKITTILKEIEHAKAHEFNRIIHHVLYRPGTKVCMALWYLDSMRIVREYFEEFGVKVLTLSGACPMNKRKEIIRLFNESGNEYRLLLLHPAVGGIGIDLHSLSKHEKIYGFINTNYDIIKLNQTAGRWNRKGQKSKPTTRYLYIDNEETDSTIQRELAIMAKLAQKSGILSKVKAVDETKYPLPGNLDNEFEAEFIENLDKPII